MPSKILLVSVNRCEAPCAVFPLGLGYLDAALKRAGHQTRWHDCQLEQTPLTKVLAEFHPDFVGISLRNIDDVVITHQETFFDGLAGLCREIRSQSDARIILGGSGFSIFPGQLLELSGADFGIQGPGERCLVALLEKLETGRDIAALPGLVFRHDKQIKINPCRELAGVEPFHFPERPPTAVEFYLQRSGMLNVQTQRGCAFHCCYCTYPLIEGHHCQRRSGEEVAEEFAVIQRLGARYIFIVDSVFNSSTKHAAQVCEALLRRNLKIRWGCFLRPQGLSAELMRLMARAGLAHIEFGTDSFCDEVLAAYGKRFTFEDVYESSELARREKIDYCHFLICGGPGETMQTLERGFINSQRLQQAVILALVGMRVYPGTPLHTQLRHSPALADNGAHSIVPLSEDDLLQPHYYLSPGLTQEELFAKLREFTRRSPNWVVGDPAPMYLHAVERLRAKGVVGPLWSYFALMQRLGTSAPVLQEH